MNMNRMKECLLRNSEGKHDEELRELEVKAANAPTLAECAKLLCEAAWDEASFVDVAVRSGFKYSQAYAASAGLHWST